MLWFEMRERPGLSGSPRYSDDAASPLPRGREPTMWITAPAPRRAHKERGVETCRPCVADYNQTARPFIWTKSEVYQKRLKPCFAQQ